MSSETTYYVNGQSETEHRPSRPERRKFSKAYKRRIVQEVSRCGHGEIGALLRREGLYSSQLTKWRREEARGELSESSSKKKSNKRKVSEAAALREENARLNRKLEQAELIIDAQKKLSQALEQTLSEPKDKS